MIQFFNIWYNILYNIIIYVSFKNLDTFKTVLNSFSFAPSVALGMVKIKLMMKMMELFL